MKKVLGATAPFFLFHLFCCGALLIFLTTSGYLLLIRQEGDKKTFLIPLLFLGGFLFWLHHRYNKHCDEKGCRTLADRIILIVFYIVFSILLGLAFMIYIFIPWWIPGYRGGIILP